MVPVSETSFVIRQAVPLLAFEWRLVIGTEHVKGIIDGRRLGRPWTAADVFVY